MVPESQNDYNSQNSFKMKAVTRLGTVPSDTQKRGYPARFLKCGTRVKRLFCACVKFTDIAFNKRSF